MNYSGKRVALTGVTGFIGRALYEELTRQGAFVDVFVGDIRDPKTFSDDISGLGLTHEHEYLFHFAAPSSQVLFQRNQAHCADVTINGFINAANACRKTGTKLIYPSTGLLSQNQVNEYAGAKAICEGYADMLQIDALGIRIFATYGPGEGHKRDYASVPYLFARDMVNNKAPVIWGTGEQVRDFIYIDDTVAGILELAEFCDKPIVDLASGQAISFNEIVTAIATRVPAPDPIHLNKPQNYVEGTYADITEMLKYYTPKVSFQAGIEKVIDKLEERRSEQSNSNHNN